WTIIWHGRVIRNPNVASEPTIEVVIRSKVQGALQDSLIEVGAGQLPLLKIGSYWIDGKLTTGVPEIVENLTLSNVIITRENTKLINTWHKIDSSKYAINPQIVKIPYNVSKSKCLAIEYRGDPYGIIIPASEIARFYYCHSTDLSHSAFWGEYSYDIDQIVNLEKCGYDEELDRAIIHLRQKFANPDAWTIGRILFDKSASTGVQEIHHSLVRHMDTDDSGFFNCGVPFTGETRWVAKGINMGTVKQPRYLILQLTRCSHSFPFSELQVDRDNNATQVDPQSDIAPEDKKQYNRIQPNKPSDENNTSSLNSETETHKNIQISNLLTQSAQFDFLEGKEIIKPDSKEFNQYKSVPNQAKAPNPEGLGTGQGDYSGDSTNQPVKINRRKGVGADLDMLTEAVSILSKAGMKIKIREVSEMPLSAPAGRRQWAYLDSGTLTKRRYIAIDITIGNLHYVWIDIEQRRKGECSVGLLKHNEKIGDEALALILRNLSRLKGVWDGKSGSALINGTEIKFERILHTWDSACKLALTIKHKIN
ncbi:MAG: hypothetical protein IBX55_17365, partial [Methyloprofundus sp.]|nr:hypothetical protein [Methyloprofundus sp.]